MAFYDALNIGVDMALNYSNLVLKSGLSKSTIYFDLKPHVYERLCKSGKVIFC